MMTTPARITADIRRLCRKIGGVSGPLFVDVSPRTDSGQDDCFVDVRKQVDEQGGGVQHGWTIWEWPGIAAECEFHAVWRKPDGQLLDVTRKEDGESRILFAPDNQRVFTEKRVANVIMGIGRDPRIKEWIEVNERFDRLVSRQMRGVTFGTEYQLQGEALELKMRAVRLQYELSESREARRAVSTRTPLSKNS